MKLNDKNQIVISKEELDVVPVVRLVWFFNGHSDNHHLCCPLGMKKERVIKGIIKHIPYEEFLLCKNRCKSGVNQILIDEDLHWRLVLKTQNIPSRIILKNGMIETYYGLGRKVYNKNCNLIYSFGDCEGEKLLNIKEYKTITIDNHSLTFDRTWCGVRDCFNTIDKWKEFVEIVKERNV